MRSTQALNALGRSLSNKVHKFRRLLHLTVCVLGIALPAIAAPSDLDPAFGSGGKVIWSPNNQSAFGLGMALQPDGKIVMVGGNFADPGNLGFVVARYNANGGLDTSFGSNGWITVTFGYSREAAKTVAIQPDGKIVVGGNLYNGLFDIGIVRFNANGSLDNSFDGDGKTIVNYSGSQGSWDDDCASIKVANDGKIVFAGDTSGASADIQLNVGAIERGRLARSIVRRTVC